MSNIPAELKYLSSHEWARIENDGTITVGITDFAQDQLGDVVYVQLPEVGTVVAFEQDIAVVESVKAASDIYAPASGTIVAINDALPDTPELINEDPYGKGWFFKIQPDANNSANNLLDAQGYAAAIK